MPAVPDSSSPGERADGPRPLLPAGAAWAADLVVAPEALRTAIDALIGDVVVVDDLPAARVLLSERANLRAVTRGGDLLGAHWAAGGSSGAPSTLEVQAAVDESQAELDEVTALLVRLDVELTIVRERAEAAERRRGAGAAGPARLRRPAVRGGRGTRPVRRSGAVRRVGGAAAAGPARTGRAVARAAAADVDRADRAADRGAGGRHRRTGRCRHLRARHTARRGRPCPAGRDGRPAGAAHGRGAGASDRRHRRRPAPRCPHRTGDPGQGRDRRTPPCGARRTRRSGGRPRPGDGRARRRIVGPGDRDP